MPTERGCINEPFLLISRNTYKSLSFNELDEPARTTDRSYRTKNSNSRNATIREHSQSYVGDN